MTNLTDKYWWESEREPTGSYAATLAVAVRSAGRTGLRYQVRRDEEGRWRVSRTVRRRVRGVRTSERQG